eukprot:4826357-Lingulodinium_polyedra.AAC.1
MRAPENWRAHGVRERAICEPLLQRTIDSFAPLRTVSQTRRNDAAESIVHCRAGSRIDRVVVR